MKGFVSDFQKTLQTVPFVRGHCAVVMNTFKKMLLWEPVLQVYFFNQEEDSEEEPKLKYERLSNGVTEILQKDAASCMTVHDKVEVIIHLPQGQVHPIPSTDFTLFMYTFEWCPLQSWFSSPICEGSPFFSHLPLLFLSGSYIKRHQALLSSPLFIPTLAYFSLLSSVCRMLIFLRGPFSARCLIVVAPAAHMHAWAEQKSYPVMSPHLMFY